VRSRTRRFGGVQSSHRVVPCRVHVGKSSRRGASVRAIRTILTCLGVALGGTLGSIAHAQATTPPPGAVPTPEQLRPAEPAARPGTTLPDTPAPPRELGKPSDEVAIDVASYAVDASAPAELRAALPQLTAAFVGKQRSYEDLVNAAAAVTRFLQRELGFYLGYAYLPEQKPEGGVIRRATLFDSRAASNFHPGASTGSIPRERSKLGHGDAERTVGRDPEPGHPGSSGRVGEGPEPSHDLLDALHPLRPGSRRARGPCGGSPG